MNENETKYLTENEKNIFGYTENVPSENMSLHESWNNEDVETIETLNDIFNL